MTEHEIRDELQAIAALSPDAMTLEIAHRSHHLKGCLKVIERARLPPGQELGVDTEH